MATHQSRKGKALFVRSVPVDKIFQAMEFVKENNLELEVISRLPGKESGILSHDDFLQKLSSVEYYLDLKGFTRPDVLTVSGIEAIKAGCKVLVDTGEIVESFTGTSFDDYIKMYRELMDTR